MCWGCFGSVGKVELAFPSSRMDSIEYQGLLDSHLLPFLRKFRPLKLIFQHDNASVHASSSTNRWLKSKKIKVLKWPACSPDLNPMENLWGIVARRLYTENRRFENVDELKRGIVNAWSSIGQETIDNLISSMPDRVFQVISRKGKQINY